MADLTTLENEIFDKEGVRVVFRKAKDTNTNISNYGYQRKLSDRQNITDLRNRINSMMQNENLTYSIILGDGNLDPHGLTSMEKARNSYKD